MIVVDASAVLDLLLRRRAAVAIGRRLLDPAETLHAPHLIDVEVAQVLRRHEAAGTMGLGRSRDAFSDLAALPLTRYPHGFLLPRVWELRKNLTAYDAVYVSLAEVLSAPLLTRDRRLSNAPGHNAQIELV